MAAKLSASKATSGRRGARRSSEDGKAGAKGPGAERFPPLTRRELHLPPSNSDAAAIPEEAAAYVLEMSLALRNIANDTGMVFLAYLLDMAAEEADGQVQRLRKGA